MKIKLLFVLCVLPFTLKLQAQCFTLQEVSVNADGTSTLLIDTNNGTSVIGPYSVSITPDQNGSFEYVVSTSLLINPSFLPSFIQLSPTICFSSISVDLSYIVNESAIELNATSGCGACDGSICYAASPNISFEAGGVSSSVNGCASNLCSGDYTVSFQPITSLNGVVYSYYDLNVSVGDFEVGFDVDLLTSTINPIISGGSGDYTIEIDPLLENPDGPGYLGPGCITINVIDNVTGCTSSFTDHYNAGFQSQDLAGGPGGTPDGLVNTADLLVFLQHYGNLLGDGSYASQMDFNCDGIINTADLLIFLEA